MGLRVIIEQTATVASVGTLSLICTPACAVTKRPLGQCELNPSIVYYLTVQ